MRVFFNIVSGANPVNHGVGSSWTTIPAHILAQPQHKHDQAPTTEEVKASAKETAALGSYGS